MQKMKINYHAYKYAPETARASVNGQPVNIRDTAAPLAICTGREAEATAIIKRIYRQDQKKPARYIYAFQDENGKAFYYIHMLSFTASDDIKRRLWAYKELKNHLKKYPPTYTTESGHITPNGATRPEVTTEAARINFNKLLILKIA